MVPGNGYVAPLSVLLHARPCCKVYFPYSVKFLPELICDMYIAFSFCVYIPEYDVSHQLMYDSNVLWYYDDVRVCMFICRLWKIIVD